MKMININSAREIDYVPEGFSWTALFFGVFVPFFRGDIIMAIGLAAVCFFTVGIGVPFVWLYLAYSYNEHCIRKLEAAGYVSEARYLQLQKAGKV